MSTYQAWIDEQEDPQQFEGFRSKGHIRQQSRRAWINEGLDRYADWLASLPPEKREQHLRLEATKSPNDE